MYWRNTCGKVKATVSIKITTEFIKVNFILFFGKVTKLSLLINLRIDFF